MFWKISLVFVFAFLAMNVFAAEHQEMSALPKNSDGYSEITADQLNAALKNKNFTLVNVHIPYEGEIPQTDLQIPFNQIADNLEKLPGKDQPIVVYCRSGNMSKTASRELVSLGYTNIVELTGGFNAWKQAGYELLRDAKK
jgi:rhodanese-related sulfurtransferase